MTPKRWRSTWLKWLMKTDIETVMEKHESEMVKLSKKRNKEAISMGNRLGTLICHTYDLTGEMYDLTGEICRLKNSLEEIVEPLIEKLQRAENRIMGLRIELEKQKVLCVAMMKKMNGAERYNGIKENREPSELGEMR